MSEWKRVSLREAGVSLIDCDHRTPPAADSGYPYVAIPQIKQGRLDLSNARYISPAHFVEWTRKAKPRHYDVILSRRCNPGETAYVPAGLECALGQNLVLLRSDTTKVFPPFLRWLVRGPDWWGQINTFINVGAIFDSLKCADIPNFKIPLPPLHEQKSIAHILGTLDDKIELNRRMNETLEAIARALFKSWFVDFDPVRAKMSGEPPASICQRLGLTPDLLALFPDRLVDSELGEIPEGWRYSSIGNEVSIVGGATPSTTNSEYWNGEYAWVTPKDLSGVAAKVLIDSERKITQAGVKKISSGQLPVGTVLLSSRAPIGYLALAMIPVSINQGFIAMRCDKRLPNTYVLQWASENLDAIKQRGSGTTFAEISKTNFRQMSVPVPDERVLKAFHQQVMPLYKQITAKVCESEMIATLRDALLPKLLSGELRVPQAEETLESVA